VSLRSVYVRFEDLDALAVEAARRQWERISRLARPLSSTGPRSERITAFVEQRCRILEFAAPVRRAAEIQEPFSPALAELLRWARGLARDEVEHVFAAELDARSRGARARLLDGLDVVAGATTWDALRRQRELSPAVSGRVVEAMLAALLAFDRDDKEA
jgi:AcrR family transcriptional regulator